MKSRCLIALASFCFFVSAANSQEAADTGLFVHEWGTFTSIAGAKGEAVVWSPQVERDDLPSFVEHLGNSRTKGGLQGSVRMETPILYFYATHPTIVSVRVSFAQGLLTEWYPHATTPLAPRQLSEPIVDLRSSMGELSWNSISVDPNGAQNFSKENAASRYYAARETSASSLTVSSHTSRQHEKFLFYRGVSSFAVPVSAAPMNDGRVLVSNREQAAIPQAILFERRGQRIGYRILGPVRNSSIVPPPELTANINSLSRDLEKILIEQGLFRDEAHAMLQTWNDSWFEEGVRVFYIVPRAFVDSILPLIIEPAPAKTTRVFVGRMEIVTPATEHAIETAFASGDQATLAKYGRFLAPILQIMIARSHDVSHTAQLQKYLSTAYIQLYALIQNGG
jgi:hypothetical protein